MASKFIASWGIIGTGGISTKFVLDLQTANRVKVQEYKQQVSHAIAAVCSRSKEKAAQFINEKCPDGAIAQMENLVSYKPEPCEGKEELFANPNVNVIYVGTPHTSHYEDAKAAIEAGKGVLLEKPATLNAAEFKHLSQIAKEKNVFLMEAVWIRFNPIMYKLQDLIFKENAIGDIRAVYSDFSINYMSVFGDEHRVLNPYLAGGGLLDLGPYPLAHAMLALFQHPKNDRTPPSAVTGSMIKTHTGVDLTTSYTLAFEKISAMAFLSTSMAYNTPDECTTRFIGTEGEIIIPGNCSRPTKLIVKKLESADRKALRKEVQVVESDMERWGLQYESDEVARCLAEGKIESERMPHDETIITMEIFDKVRKDGNYTYPQGLEKVN